MAEPAVQGRGERVYLRDPVPEDLEPLVRWWTTDTEWAAWDAPWEPMPTDAEEVREKWRAWLEKQPQVPRGRVIVCLLDGTPVGTVNTYHVDKDPDRVAVGISISESRHWGDGLGTEAFRLWVSHVLEERDLPRVYCETWSGNARMVRLAERMGFREIRRRVDARSVDGKRWDALRFVLDRADLSPATPR